MMICSYGDFTDVAIFRELGLSAIVTIDSEGKMTGAWGELAGLRVNQARKRVVELLKERGAVVREEKKQQKVPICERSRTPIEIISLKEWYVKQTEALDSLRDIAAKIDFHPDRHRGILLDWVNAITIDWPVSRRRYFHTEIPVWYCKSCNEAHVPKPGPYYQPWKEAPPAEISKCRKCGHSDFEGEGKVFDTWMDSSASNLYVTHYHDAPDWFRRNFPTSIRPQGRDIVRTWLHYTLLKSHLLLGGPGFKHVWITGLGMDEKGRKMSKSLGNVIDPDEVLNEVGADAFRFWAASECTIGDDFRISRERISGAGKFLTKLYNVARFISSFDVPSSRPPKTHPVDEWILAEMNRVTDECRAGYDDFNFFKPSTSIRNFVWNIFAPHYLEMVKARAYENDASALWTLHEVLRRTLMCLAPVCPFSTHHIHHALYATDVHEARLPAKLDGVDAGFLDYTPKIEEFNSEVWKLKKEKGLPLNAPLPGVEVPGELAQFRDSLIAMHKLH
jgi:valyl-tRNA synthetase